MALEFGRVNACFEMNERLARLECYDTLLGRPGEIDLNVQSPQTDADAPVQTPNAIQFVEKLIEKGQSTENGVLVALLERGGHKRYATQGKTAVEFMKSIRSQADIETVRETANLYIILPSIKTLGEEAVLVASCIEDITNLDIYWYQSLGKREVTARFLTGNELSINTPVVKRQIKITGSGYILSNPRGLESIRTLNKFASGARGQVSIEQGNTVRSSFFETRALRNVLPFIAKHCSWKSRN